MDSNKSSTDSRISLGTLGHNSEWDYTNQEINISVGSESGDQESSESDGLTMFRRVDNIDPGYMVAIAGITVVGSAYFGYKKLPLEMESTKNDNLSNVENRSPDGSQDTGPTISKYAEIHLGDTITDSSEYQLQQGELDEHQFWVLTPPVGESETVSTAAFELFNEKLDSWSGMDSHQHLVNVFAAGSDPLPWAAVEQTDDTPLVDHIDTLSMAETVEALEKVCEALHHVHRYGTVYENLTTDSVLYIGEGTVTLRGVLDAFDEPDPWYNAPEEFHGELTERSTVYRIGLIAYELFTRRLPYEEYPDGHPEEAVESEVTRSDMLSTEELPPALADELVKALSKNPADRHETVLHLRDSFSEIVSE